MGDPLGSLRFYSSFMIAVALLAPVGMLMLLLAMERLEQRTGAEPPVEIDVPRAELRSENPPTLLP